MRIVFAGTPDFAAAALNAIIDAASGAGWTVPLVLTQPDRPAGRGMKMQASPVKQLALAHGIEVDTPSSLRKGDSAAAAQARLKAVEPDVVVVAAYGLILPPEVLAIPRGLRSGWQPKLSALNIHASLLPRWRGAAPVARAIEAGDTETGITLMQMDAGLDTGPMLVAERVAITRDDTTETLTATLADVGARLIVEAMRQVDGLVATPQPKGGTYAAKLSKSEAWLDWSQSADELERKVRAFNPFPVASSTLNGATVRIWRAHATGDRPTPSAGVGRVNFTNGSGMRVACGIGELVLAELQRANGKRVAAREFISGASVKAGDRFVSPYTLATE
ncbi:MAG TPA: methionyl-tRNA formyltransferase [Burkholderiaceae bacterium]|nr:methionyl-tRNA formyltransferase [Burkholderiaceae bacterium]